MTDFWILLITACILIGAGAYIRSRKKRGAKCVGCPYAQSCGGCCEKSE